MQCFLILFQSKIILLHKTTSKVVLSEVYPQTEEDIFEIKL